MNELTKKHPLAMAVILMMISFLTAGILTAVLASLGFDSGTAASISRLFMAVVLLFLFRRDFDFSRSLKGFVLALPALVFVVWNIAYHLCAGIAFRPLSEAGMILLTALAPGLFEEVLFRGVVTGKIQGAGKSQLYAVLAPALLFGLIHLTNAPAIGPLSALVQALYATVIGLLFGAVYVRTRDIVSPVLMHTLIDLSNDVFVSSPTSSTVPWLIAFAVIIAASAVYSVALIVVRDVQKKQTQIQ